MEITLFSHIDFKSFKTWFFQAWAKVITWFNIVCGAIKNILIALLTDHTSSWITSSTIHGISEGIAFLVTSFIFILIFTFIWKGIGTSLKKLITILFIQCGDGVLYLAKEAIYKIFASVAWIFTSIANGIKKILFGKT